MDNNCSINNFKTLRPTRRIITFIFRFYVVKSPLIIHKMIFSSCLQRLLAGLRSLLLSRRIRSNCCDANRLHLPISKINSIVALSPLQEKEGNALWMELKVPSSLLALSVRSRTKIVAILEYLVINSFSLMPECIVKQCNRSPLHSRSIHIFYLHHTDLFSHC